MANVAKNAILRAKIEGVLTDIMVKTTAANVFVDDTTTLAAKLATLAAQADLAALQQTVDALGALAGKDKVSESDLDTALAAILNGKATIASLNEEIARAQAAEQANATAAAEAKTAADNAQAAADAAQADVDALEPRVATVEGQIATLNGTGAGSVDKKITDAFNDFSTKVTDDAVVNSYKELIDWAAEHGSDAAEMAASISTLQNILAGIGGDGESATVVAYVTAAIEALKIGDYAKAADLTALAGRVSTAEGKITALETTVGSLGDMATKDIVSESDLSTELAEKVNAAAEGNHSHANKSTLDGITPEKVAAWDASEQNAKGYADGLNTAMNTRVTAVEEKAHTHANKTVLDGITADQLTGFGKKANIYYSASEPENLTENDLWVALV